ncbi:MAG: T9SS type A sorting domain-containing protein, partial [Paramuribaculum sp.]|nr:T9SS type A sorting domain-containing protein [Paramuribaculum sp.]
GNWTSPFGWVPGAMSDAAHKNGVLVSGVASIPNASIPTNWANCLAGIGAMNNEAGIEKLGKFLRYHGVDGLGYNSEYYSGGAYGPNLRGVHGKLVKWMKQYQPNFENVWYGGTNDNGSVNFNDQLSSDFYQTFGYADEPRTILFLNYNWNQTNKLSQDAAGIAATGRDPRDLYMGMNMQGGLKTATEWGQHLMMPYSIGLWGAHSVNYIWNNRNANGSTDAAKQSTYQTHLEYWFTNGKRNPLYQMAPVNSLTANEKFMGMSRYMEARSTLKWDLATEPFVTYFNLGGGSYYNWKGQQERVAPWYNLGVQDYMPTWRFWFATEYLGNTPSTNIDANLTWNDAYMGGSSLRLTANNKEASYLHLFKTEFDAKNNTKFTIRYKVLKGKGDVELVWSKLGTESQEAQGAYGMVFDKDGNTYSSNKADGKLDYDGEWQYKTLTLTSRNKLTGTISAIALKIENAEDLEVLIGEISLTNGTYAAPAAPIITRAKVLANNYKGVDGKIFYKMNNTKEPGEPVYNLDVKTSLFRLWSKTDADAEPKFLGTTSSWAGMIYSAPANGATKIQFGVSAVSLDFSQESEISWSEEMPVGDYVAVEDLKVSKSPLTTDEDFYVEFVDPAHAAVDWKITDEGGNPVATASNSTRIEVANGLSNTGSYDVYAGEIKHASLISVSDPGSGRQPIIESLTIDGENAGANVEISANESKLLGYTGRDADGIGSRGVKLDELTFGAKVSDLGLGTYQSFSVAFWLKVNVYPTAAPGSLLLIENRGGAWPKNNWGYFWNRTVEGSLRNHKIDGGWGKSLDGGADGMRLYCDYDANLGTAKWNHLVYVFEYNDQKRVRMKFYLNGALQNISNWLWVNKMTRESKIGSSESGWEDITLTPGYESIGSGYGSDVTETDWCIDNCPLSQSDWINVGGPGPNGMAAVDGVIDDFQIWGKAMTQEDVNLSKNGLGKLETLPEDVIAFWDLEGDAADDYGFVSRGSKQVKAYLCEYLPTGLEGQLEHVPAKAEYSAGSPFVPGSAYAVVTSPSWTARKGVLTEATGNANEGSVKLTYGENRTGGDYTVTLTLANALGSDTKDYPVFSVISAIDGVEADTEEGVEAYTVGEMMFVEFAEAGNYAVEVYNTNGMLMAQKSQHMEAGHNMSISLGAKGVYIVRVMRDGALARTIKVIRK